MRTHGSTAASWTSGSACSRPPNCSGFTSTWCCRRKRTTTSLTTAGWAWHVRSITVSSWRASATTASSSTLAKRTEIPWPTARNTWPTCTARTRTSTRAPCTRSTRTCTATPCSTSPLSRPATQPSPTPPPATLLSVPSKRGTSWLLCWTRSATTASAHPLTVMTLRRTWCGGRCCGPR